MDNKQPLISSLFSMLRAQLTYGDVTTDLSEESAAGLLSTSIERLREKVNLKLTELCEVEKELKMKDEPKSKKSKSS